MHKAKKKQLRNWLRIGSTSCLAPRLTTSQPPHFLINLTIDIGRRCFRRRPAIHPRPVEGRGIPPNLLKCLILFMQQGTYLQIVKLALLNIHNYLEMREKLGY
jgi:hypothetical protein